MRPVRGVCAEYGETRHEIPSDGRWIAPEDVLERRRVVFLGALARQRLFGERPAVGETILIGGLRFTVIGSMDRKMQLSNYFWSDDESMFIPFSAAGDLWDTRYANVLLFSTVNMQFESKAMAQVLAAVAKRQRFSPTDKRAMVMSGRQEFRPIIDGLTIGVPAFFLALAPNFRRLVPGFAYRVARFVLPTGFLSAVAMLVSFLTLEELGATREQAQTMEIIVFATVGLRVISVIERPLRGWRLGMVLAIVGVYAFGFWWSVTTKFFAVVWPTSWVVIVVAAAWCVAVWFWVGLGKPIGDRLPFWRERAHTAERAAENSAEEPAEESAGTS